MKVQRAHCDVRTESLSIIHVNFRREHYFFFNLWCFTLMNLGLQEYITENTTVRGPIQTKLSFLKPSYGNVLELIRLTLLR